MFRIFTKKGSKKWNGICQFIISALLSVKRRTSPTRYENIYKGKKELCSIKKAIWKLHKNVLHIRCQWKIRKLHRNEKKSRLLDNLNLPCSGNIRNVHEKNNFLFFIIYSRRLWHAKPNPKLIIGSIFDLVLIKESDKRKMISSFLLYHILSLFFPFLYKCNCLLGPVPIRGSTVICPWNRKENLVSRAYWFLSVQVEFLLTVSLVSQIFPRFQRSDFFYQIDHSNLKI